MHNDDIQALLQRHLAQCDVSVAGDGRHVEITVVGDAFAGLRPVKRQQLVYAVLAERIASGDIHAVQMNLFDRQQWEAAHGAAGH